MLDRNRKSLKCDRNRNNMLGKTISRKTSTSYPLQNRIVDF